MTDKTTKTNKQPGKIFRKGMGKKMKKKTTLKGLKIKTTKPTSDSKAKLTIKSTIKKKSKKPQTVVESAPIKSVTAGFIVESIFQHQVSLLGIINHFLFIQSAPKNGGKKFHG